jgi:hypothetical protein
VHPNLVAFGPHAEHACSMATTTDEARAHFAEKLVVARGRVGGLDEGPVRAALSDRFFAGIEDVSPLTCPVGRAGRRCSYMPLMIAASTSPTSTPRSRP